MIYINAYFQIFHVCNFCLRTNGNIMKLSHYNARHKCDILATTLIIIYSKPIVNISDSKVYFFRHLDL